ncbi:MAG: hypothetical protein IKS51_03935 [Erysipelotrichaceae bacterium]|nr:hypothetical protein [Erysipelotrichaceae bacterium]
MNDYTDDTLIMEKPEYRIDDVLDVLDWMGKTPAEAGLDLELSAGNGLDFKGLLFGKEIYSGTAYMGFKEKADVFDRVFMIVSDSSLTKTKLYDRLTERFGKPYEEGEEPYAQANGGVVFWYRFYTGKGTLDFSYGENNDHSTLRYRLSDPPAIAETEEEL